MTATSEARALRSAGYDPILLKSALDTALDQSMELQDSILAHIIARAIDRAKDVGAFDDMAEIEQAIITYYSDPPDRPH